MWAEENDVNIPLPQRRLSKYEILGSLFLRALVMVLLCTIERKAIQVPLGLHPALIQSMPVRKNNQSVGDPLRIVTKLQHDDESRCRVQD